MVQDEPKLLDDAGENNQISRRRLAVQFPAAKSPLYLIGILARWSTASCALAFACRRSASKEKEKEKKSNYLRL